MTQENKELLLKDLCARLPYKVYAQISDEYCDYTSAIESIDIDGFVKDFEGAQIEIENIKTYLLPLSSMTEEQWKEYQTLKMTDWVEGDINGVFINAGTITDWLNKNHFDYRGLIEKGLAIDTTGLNIY